MSDNMRITKRMRNIINAWKEANSDDTFFRSLGDQEIVQLIMCSWTRDHFETKKADDILS